MNECKVYVLNVECDSTSYPNLIVLALFPKGSNPPPGINHKNPVWNTGDKLVINNCLFTVHKVTVRSAKK